MKKKSVLAIILSAIFAALFLTACTPPALSPDKEYKESLKGTKVEVESGSKKETYYVAIKFYSFAPIEDGHYKFDMTFDESDNSKTELDYEVNPLGIWKSKDADGLTQNLILNVLKDGSSDSSDYKKFQEYTKKQVNGYGTYGLLAGETYTYIVVGICEKEDTAMNYTLKITNADNKDDTTPSEDKQPSEKE